MFLIVCNLVQLELLCSHWCKIGNSRFIAHTSPCSLCVPCAYNKENRIHTLNKVHSVWHLLRNGWLQSLMLGILIIYGICFPQKLHWQTWILSCEGRFDIRVSCVFLSLIWHCFFDIVKARTHFSQSTLNFCINFNLRVY